MLIETSALNIQYASQDATQAVTLPPLTIDKGHHTLLIGPSGVGKTSLLLALAGLLKPASGHVVIENQPMYDLSEAKRDMFRAKHIGMVFQTLHLLPHLTAKQNILLGDAGNKNDILVELTQSLGITELLERKPHQLSQGQAQRVAIARALIASPKVLLADEPTAALDDDNAQAVASLLQQTAQQYGTTLLIVTHDARLKNNKDFQCVSLETKGPENA